MKLIAAIIRPDKFRDVKEALFAEGVFMMTQFDVRGCGQQKGFPLEYRGVIEEVNLHRKTMLLIGVNESYVKKTVKAIVGAARTNGGHVGDGKIFVLDLEDCVRIRTGECGVAGIGGRSAELDALKGKVTTIK